MPLLSNTSVVCPRCRRTAIEDLQQSSVEGTTRIWRCATCGHTWIHAKARHPVQDTSCIAPEATPWSAAETAKGSLADCTLRSTLWRILGVA
jgi:hypothetical protein